MNLILKENELFANVLPEHPCMNLDLQNSIPRLHLPVAYKCNIQCNYCERYICSPESSENYPGITAEVLSPLQALFKANIFINKWGMNSVIGISGPGDPLANRETFETFKLIRQNYPLIKLCLCTNGLNLPEYIDVIKGLGIEFLSVSVNAINPLILAKINSYVRKDGFTYTGQQGAEILIKNQLIGVKAAIEYNLHVKINTVVIPEINDFHIRMISQRFASLGCSTHNIMPLIPRGRFKQIQRPSISYMRLLQKESGKYLYIFSKCRQCRADAEGIPGGEGCCE